MVTLMKRYEHFMKNKRAKKIYKKATKMYPKLDWSVSDPAEEIERIYGKGFILKVKKRNDIKIAEYFILNEDPRLEQWIHLIVIKLGEMYESA